MGAEPRTAAGRAMFTKDRPWFLPQLGEVLAIEVEAVAAYKAELAEKVRALPSNPVSLPGEYRAAVLALIEEPS